MQQNDNITLNPQITNQISIQELKYLINTAKQYLKNKITTNPNFKNLNIDKDKLPKTLKGLTQIAKKLNIDITKITYEIIKPDKNSNNIPTPNFNQSVQKTKYISQNNQNTKILSNNRNFTSQNSQLTNQPQTNQTNHNLSSAINIKNQNKLSQNNSNQTGVIKQVQTKTITNTIKTSDSNSTQTIQNTTLETIKQIPIFSSKASRNITKTTISTTQIITKKTNKKEEATNITNNKTQNLLQELLSSSKITSSMKPSIENGILNLQTNTPSNTNNNTNQNQNETQFSSLEELLKNQTMDNAQKNDINTHKSDELQVKIKESKQMIKYLSEDIKKAIDEYKPPFSRIKVKLNPQKLGEIDLTVVQRGKNVHINLSSNNAALNILTNNLSDLKVQLSNNGINNASFNFNSQNQNEQNRQQQRKKEALSNYNALNDEQEEINSLEIIVPRYV
jgi:hypothetical protein